MVGDLGSDCIRGIKGAKAIGMITCLAKYGQHFRGEVKADYEIEKFEDLKGLIEEIEG